MKFTSIPAARWSRLNYKRETLVGEGDGCSENPGLGDYRSWEERVGMVWGGLRGEEVRV